MDLKLFVVVLWRFRLVVAAGTLVAVLLASASTVKLVLADGGPRVEYRTPEVWQSSSMVLLTQKGFPWGRSTLNDVVPLRGSGDSEATGQFAPRFADMPRYQGLAVIYAHLAASDEVRRQVLSDAPQGADYGAEAVRASDGTSYLPMIEIKALGPSPAAARAIAMRATRAFRSYLIENQKENAVPDSQRVEIPVVNEPRKATLFQSHSLTRPAFIFMLTMTLVIGLAFMLENLHSRDRVPTRPASGIGPPPARDSHELVDLERPAA